VGHTPRPPALEEDPHRNVQPELDARGDPRGEQRMAAELGELST
jgi:hypothetical protein